MKKLTFVMVAFGLAMFAACGDDSSSSSGSVDRDAQGRKIYYDMQAAMEAPCSKANQCEEIIMDDPIAQDTLICLGTLFQSKIGKDLSKCSEPADDDAAPADTSADAPADTPTAKEPIVINALLDLKNIPCTKANKCEIVIANDESINYHETLQCNGSGFQILVGEDYIPVCGPDSLDYIVEEPVDTSYVSCMIITIVKFGGGLNSSSRSCVEAVAGSDYAETMIENCVDIEAGNMGVEQKATLGKFCTGSYKHCTFADHVTYLYDEDADCADAK